MPLQSGHLCREVSTTSGTPIPELKSALMLPLPFLLSQAVGSGQLYLASNLGFQAHCNIMCRQMVVVIVTNFRGLK